MAEVGGFGGWNLNLADDVFALVVEEIALGGDGGVIAGEVEIDIDGVGGFIDDVAGREGDVEAIAPAASGVEVDGIDARLVVEGQDSEPTTRGRTSKKRTGLVGVLVRGQLVVDFDGLVEGGGLDELE